MSRTVENSKGVKKVYTTQVNEAWRRQAFVNQVSNELTTLLAMLANGNGYVPAEQRINEVTVKIEVAFPDGLTRTLVFDS